MKYIVLFFLFCTSLFSSEFIVSYRGPESDTDTRFEYPLALLKASLEATKKEFGPYILKPVYRFNNKRAQEPDYISSLTNFIYESSISMDREDKLLSVKIPTAKGIFGYRIFLIDKINQPIFDKIKTVEDLKKISFGQNDSWLDYKILQSNGFNVVSGNNYDGLFAMLANGRFQAFPRGINEAFKEVEQRKKDFPNIVVEKNICIYYPLPRYFYTAKKNKLLAERVTKGMQSIISDGTFDKIWTQYNYPSVKLSNLATRRIFYTDNPFISDDIKNSTKKYLYNPK